MFEFIEVINIKYYQGRAEFLPWSFWGESTKEKRKNTEQSHAGLLHCPPTAFATSYALSLDPTHGRRVLHVVVVCYSSSVGLTRRGLMGLEPRRVRIAAPVFESLPLGSRLSPCSSRSFSLSSHPSFSRRFTRPRPRLNRRRRCLIVVSIVVVVVCLARPRFVRPSSLSSHPSPCQLACPPRSSLRSSLSPCPSASLWRCLASSRSSFPSSLSPQPSQPSSVSLLVLMVLCPFPSSLCPFPLPRRRFLPYSPSRRPSSISPFIVVASGFCFILVAG